MLVFALRNFKSPCQISKGGGTFLICGKLVEGRDITREGKSRAVIVMTYALESLKRRTNFKVCLCRRKYLCFTFSEDNGLCQNVAMVLRQFFSLFLYGCKVVIA